MDRESCWNMFWQSLYKQWPFLPTEASIPHICWVLQIHRALQYQYFNIIFTTTKQDVSIIMIILIIKTFIEGWFGVCYYTKCFIWVRSIVMTITLTIPVERWGNQSSEKVSKLSPFYRPRTKLSKTLSKAPCCFSASPSHPCSLRPFWCPFGGSPSQPGRDQSQWSIICACKPWFVHSHKDISKVKAKGMIPVGND